MNLKNIWREIVEFFYKLDDSKWCDDLDQELEELDKKNPDWDKESRIATAQYFLKSGMARERLVFAYGEEIVKKAEEGMVFKKE